MIWRATLPLKDEHQLSDAAAAQLLEKVLGVEVALGTEKRRAERRDVVGAVTRAEPAEDNRVRVTVRLHEHDKDAETVLEGLKAGTMELGLDMSVNDCQRPGDGGVVIGTVTRVNGVLVVPAGQKSCYTDDDGTVHDGSRYTGGEGGDGD